LIFRCSKNNPDACIHCAANAVYNYGILPVTTDQAVAGNDVESTSDQLSAPSGSAHIVQVETVVDRSPIVSPSEAITSMAIATCHSGCTGDSAADVGEPVSHVDQLQHNETKQRCVAAKVITIAAIG